MRSVATDFARSVVCRCVCLSLAIIIADRDIATVNKISWACHKLMCLCCYLGILHVYRIVSKIYDSFYFSNNSIKSEQISVVLVKQNPERILIELQSPLDSLQCCKTS